MKVISGEGNMCRVGDNMETSLRQVERLYLFGVVYERSTLLLRGLSYLGAGRNKLSHEMEVAGRWMELQFRSWV